MNSALNPVENCPEDGILFDPYEKSDLVGEDTPDKYPLGDWKNRFDHYFYLWVNVLVMEGPHKRFGISNMQYLSDKIKGTVLGFNGHVLLSETLEINCTI